MSKRPKRESHNIDQSTDAELIAKLQLALTEALDQNQILKQRIIELEAMLVAAQQLNQNAQPRSRQKPRRKQPPRKAKKYSNYTKKINREKKG